MQFLIDVVVAVLGAYLAFTNALASGIIALLPEKPEAAYIPTQVETKLEEKTIVSAAPHINSLGSEYKDQASLPDILIRNAAYQSASVLGSDQSLEESASSVADALVNIYCTYTTNEYVRTNTGTGFFIDPAGVILTNAHVAQFLVLETVSETGETECIIRAGDPAVPLYEAELLHISPAWIVRHANLISEDKPKGTGERDYALLFITAGLDNKPMPSKFPYLSIDTSLLSTAMLNKNVTVAGYPAEKFLTEGADAELAPLQATTSISDMFTFGSNYADIFSISNSVIGEHGASGGPILNMDGKVIGLITTKGSEEEGAQSLRALTLSYVNRTIIEESKLDLSQMVSGQLALRAQLFTQTIVPFLSEILEDELE